jgi:hypothetical protein
MSRLPSVLAVAAVLFAAAQSRAQFFDDFDGSALAPHWQPLWTSPTSWDYQVANGLLTVNSLNAPSSGGSNRNYQYLDTFISPVFGDFTASAVMGMTAGSHRSISMRLSGTQAGILGEFIYHETGIVGIGPGGTTMLLMMLGPGLHEFKIVRTGAQVSYFMDSVHIGTLANSHVNQGAYWLRLGFEVDYPIGLPMNPMMVDRVWVVPVPGSGAVALTFLSLAILRTRGR